MMLRIFDIVLSITGLIISLPVLLLIVILSFFDTGSPIFRQQRMGKNKKPFLLIKFRTMNIDTKSVASHLADRNSITRMGRLLRKTKLDELPQLWNVLRGDMSLVGPRPNLFNQEELVHARDKLNIYSVRPGITGLSQINNIDMSRPELLAKTDSKMIKNLSISAYLKYILITLSGRGSGDRIN